MHPGNNNVMKNDDEIAIEDDQMNLLKIIIPYVWIALRQREDWEVVSLARDQSGVVNEAPYRNR
jgi:hypothetical protein